MKSGRKEELLEGARKQWEEPPNTKQQNRTNRLFYAACLVAAAGYGAWWLLTPQSYDECVLKYIGDAHSNYATRLVHESCKNQFPKKTTSP